jgi:hypothetical protein
VNGEVSTVAVSSLKARPTGAGPKVAWAACAEVDATDNAMKLVAANAMIENLDACLAMIL